MDDEHPRDDHEMPRPADDTDPAPGRVLEALGRGVTTAAVVVASVAAAGALAVLAGLLTLFGWGLAVGVALAVVTVGAALRPRPANAWLLVPVLALAAPAVAVAVSGVRVLPQRGAVIEVPRTTDQIPAAGYRAGLGDLLVDLRELRTAPGEEVVVRAGSDLGRTVVALPRDKCFALEVRWTTGGLRLPRVHERSSVLGFRSGLSLKQIGQQGPRLRKRRTVTRGRIAVFGRTSAQDHGRWVSETDDANAPRLTLELESEGGSFVVRDYPDSVEPLRSGEWPIDQVPPPYPRHVPRQALRAQLAAQSRAVQRAVQSSAPSATVAAPTPRPTPAPDVVPVPVPADSVSAFPTNPRRSLRAATELQASIWRDAAKRRQAFGRAWARRVTGACNPSGTFR